MNPEPIEGAGEQGSTLTTDTGFAGKSDPGSSRIMNPEQTDGKIEYGSSRTRVPGCVAKSEPGSSGDMNSGPVDGKKEQRLPQKTDPGPIIEVRGLSFRHPPTVSGRSVTAVQDVSLSIRPGEVVGLAGMSGSGKSTFCYCLNGLIPHLIPGTMTGTVTVFGKDTRSCRVTDLAAHVALVFQNPEDQIFSSDVESEIAFGPEQMGWPGEEIGKTIDASLEALDITHLRDRDPGELSWGERQRWRSPRPSRSTPGPGPRRTVSPGSTTRPRRVSPVSSRPSTGRGNDRDHRGTTALLAAPGCTAAGVFDQGRVVHDGPIGTLPAWYTGEDGSTRTGGIRPGVAVRGPESGPRRSPSANWNFTIPGGRSLRSRYHAWTSFPGRSRSSAGRMLREEHFIRHLNGIQKPASGELQLMGKEVRGRSTADLSRTRECFSARGLQLFAETVFEELAFGRRTLGSTRRRPKKGQECRRPPGHHRARLTSPLGLSAGEKQRVAIGSLLAMETPWWCWMNRPSARPAVQADRRGGARRAPGFGSRSHRSHP